MLVVMRELNQYNISDLNELLEAVKIKSYFELAREFTFWDITEDFEALNIIAYELNNRLKKTSIIFLLESHY